MITKNELASLAHPFTPARNINQTCTLIYLTQTFISLKIIVAKIDYLIRSIELLAVAFRYDDVATKCVMKPQLL